MEYSTALAEKGRYLMLEELRRQVYEANMMLQKYGLVKFTWGNVSGIDREQGLVVIKPSGVPYEELSPENMVVVDMEGNIVEGNLNPSTDTPTHIALYQSFPSIGGVTHTHSLYATIWAQAGLDIVAYGTTHADYFYGDIPCTLPMKKEQIETDYEKQTGYHIVDTITARRVDPLDMPACLVASHGPFTWGTSAKKSVEAAVVLEEVAHMAVFNVNFQFGLTRIQDALLDKHYLRKHGDDAYYGQNIIKPAGEESPEEGGNELKITPSAYTVELKNISQIAEAPARPNVNRPPEKEEEAFKFGNAPAEAKNAPDEMASMTAGPLDFTF